MPRLTIDGREIEALAGQTVMEAAKAAGIFIPYFCWHPRLSVPGNCRICVVGVEDKGGEWVEIACNMPVTEGMVVFTNSEKVRARRKATLQFITLNHPVDCGICDKAGECTLQDYHYEYNGERSVSIDAKAHATKHYALSNRIVLDNERCIQCTRCVRFTREISKSNGLGMQNRADHSLVRPVEDGSFASDHSGFMHNKVIVVDQRYVITGSLNFSSNAEDNNDENVIILDHPEIARLYLQDFDRVWAQAADPEPDKFPCP